MVFSCYVKQRILWYDSQGLRPPTIAQKLLEEDGIKVSRRGVLKFLTVYKVTGTICRQPGSGRPLKVTAEIKAIVEQQMELDDENNSPPAPLPAREKRVCYFFSYYIKVSYFIGMDI